MPLPDTRRTGSLRIAALGLLLLATAGCETNFVGLNENPNEPTDVEARFILPAAIQSTAENIVGLSLDRDVAELWAQHYARLQYPDVDRYRIGPDFAGEFWPPLYEETLTDLQLVIHKAREENSANKEAVGLILRAYVGHNMTDFWGDMPFSEAAKGEREGGTTTPSYDTQQEIYDQLLSDLASAASMIDPSGPTFGSQADIVYGGDMERWRRWANSLRLRLALRLSEVDPSRARSEAAAAVNGGVFTDPSDAAMRAYSGSGTDENPMFRAFTQERPNDFRISSTIVDTLKSLDDPRLPVYAQTNREGEFDGMPNGLPHQHGFPFDSLSKVGTFFLQPDTPAWFQTYEEVLFLQAEAAERGWVGGDPAELYERAIRVNMQKLGISSSEIDEYVDQERVAYDPSRGLEQIAVQKWIALFDQGPEAYAEWRRTGCPVLAPSRTNVNEDIIPLRMPYPLSEQATNQANWEQAVSRQDGAGVNTAVWWDTRQGGVCRGQTNF